MLLPEAGLQTRKWNNRLKSIALLLLYPLLITPIYIAVTAVILFFISTEMQFASDQEGFITTQLAYLATDFFWFPYFILGLYMLLEWFRDQKEEADYSALQYLPVDKLRRIETILEHLAISRGLTTPRLTVYVDPHANAFTTGLSRHRCCIAVSTGLIEQCSDKEIEAVFAHEVAHILEGDIQFLYLIALVTSFMDMMRDVTRPEESLACYRTRSMRRHAGGVAIVCIFVLHMIFRLGILGSMFARGLISMRRDYVADAIAIELTKEPSELVAALEKIDSQAPGYGYFERFRPLLFHRADRQGFMPTHPMLEDRLASVFAAFPAAQGVQRPPRV